MLISSTLSYRSGWDRRRLSHGTERRRWSLSVRGSVLQRPMARGCWCAEGLWELGTQWEGARRRREGWTRVHMRGKQS